MLMHHGGEDKAPKPEQEAILKEYIAQTELWDRSVIDHSTNDRYEVTIAKTQHGHFSDFMLAIPPNKDELDAQLGHSIVIANTLAFSDQIPARAGRRSAQRTFDQIFQRCTLNRKP